MPAVVGAVYKPELEMLPPVALHVTPVLLLPLTVVVNCCAAPEARLTDVGAIETEMTGADTVTVAVADFVESATLVVVTVYVPAALGAV